MIRKVFPPLLAVTIAGLIGLLGMSLVIAQQAGPSRSLPAGSVAPGEVLTVTITGTGYGGDRAIGQVAERLPAGDFTYEPGSATKAPGSNPKGTIRGTVDPNDSSMVAFTVVSVDSFTYQIRVGSNVADGSYMFPTGDVGGDDTIEVSSVTTTPTETPTPEPDETTTPTPSGLRRSLPADSVASGEVLTVTITGTGYGADRAIGQVAERLPAGDFTYEPDSATKAPGSNAKGTIRGTVDPNDSSMVAFTVVSVDSFTYQIRVGSNVADGSYTFPTGDVGGDDTIEVSSSGLRRSLAGSVAPGGVLTVTITGTGYGADRAIGQVTETLPAGDFTYEPDSATKVPGSNPKGTIRGTVNSNDSSMVAFTVVSVDSFTYQIRVGSNVTDGSYRFRSVGVGGASTITVETTETTSRPSTGGTTRAANRAPSFTEGAAASRSVAENSPSGTDVGEPVTATDRDRDSLDYALRGDDRNSFAIDGATGQITVGDETDLDFETKDTYSVTVRATDPDNGRDEIEVTISVTNVDEAGTVALSSMMPQVGTALTATLTDPDGSVSDVTWSWASSSDESTWTDISGATSASYTPVTDDGGKYLRATPAYTDGHGPDKSAQAASANAVPVVAPPPTPTPVPTPTATPVPTVEPTATPVPTAEPTATPVPTVEPTATPVPTVEPTATPVPTVEPTATPVPTPTPEVVDDGDGGFPVWLLVVIVLAAVVGGGGGLLVWLRMRR